MATKEQVEKVARLLYELDSGVVDMSDWYWPRIAPKYKKMLVKFARWHLRELVKARKERR